MNFDFSVFPLFKMVIFFKLHQKYDTYSWFLLEPFYFKIWLKLVIIRVIRSFTKKYILKKSINCLSLVNLIAIIILFKFKISRLSNLIFHHSFKLKTLSIFCLQKLETRLIRKLILKLIMCIQSPYQLHSYLIFKYTIKFINKHMKKIIM